MTNNAILRQICNIFDFKASKVIEIFKLAEREIKKDQVEAWLQDENTSGYMACNDTDMATFLNGFINDGRGKKEGAQPAPENKLSNNMIFRKLNIALDLQSEDVLAILAEVDVVLSKHELSAFFRKPGHKHYRACNDQMLLNYLKGLELKFRS